MELTTKWLLSTRIDKLITVFIFFIEWGKFKDYLLIGAIESVIDSSSSPYIIVIESSFLQYTTATLFFIATIFLSTSFLISSIFLSVNLGFDLAITLALSIFFFYSTKND